MSRVTDKHAFRGLGVCCEVCGDLAHRPQHDSLSSKTLSLDELEKLLSRDDEVLIEILPNGEIRYHEGERQEKPKVLTMRDNLGGEYAEVAA